MADALHSEGFRDDVHARTLWYDKAMKNMDKGDRTEDVLIMDKFTCRVRNDASP